MSAPVTEAHRQAAVSIFELAMKSSHHGAPFREPCAQFIADSEAKACAELLQQVANLKYSNHYHRKTAETSRATETDRNNLRADLDAIKSILNEEKARAERAEAEVAKLIGFYNEIVAECGHDLIVREYRQRGELLRDETNWRKKAEAELATEREKAERYRLVTLRQHLAIERGRLDWLLSYDGVDWILSAHKNRKLFEGESDNRALLEAAMKEGAK